MGTANLLRNLSCSVLLAIGMVSAVVRAPVSMAADAGNAFPGASQVPHSQQGWQRFMDGPDEDAPFDEAQGGFTARGTPLNKRDERCFPAESRNLFHEVDQVPTGPGGRLEPFAWSRDDRGRNGIRGQNTWMVWGEGNEAFWGWIQEKGYGLIDFMVMLDSRQRAHRFRDTGMMNQPGMKTSADPILGLYLDEADGDRIWMQQPASDIDAATGELATRPAPPPGHSQQLFEPGDLDLYNAVLARLPQDGLDPAVYGYPSGVVGLRLMPNPDFFGNTDDAATARSYWDQRVVQPGSDGFYERGGRVAADPDLVRPFRVSMSCGFCHIGPHPLNPPPDPENPEWQHMSSIIGNQYWTPPTLFTNLAKEDTLFYQFLASQQPGTVDASLVSTDHINNANTIIAVFDLNARLARAMENPPEAQNDTNLYFPGVEDGGRRVSPRHTPRILLDGADSIGAFAALSRVYFNIGTFPEEWARCHNPILGFTPQRPFPVKTAEANSAFWRAGDRYRIPYMVEFFTHRSAKDDRSIVAPMKLAATEQGRPLLAGEATQAAAGRRVFLRNCAVCHSSKQPEGFGLSFSEDWDQGTPPTAHAAHLVLPQRFEEWEDFRASDTFRRYGDQMEQLAGNPDAAGDAFIEDNFLSTDIRVPITLVGTNSARAVATNAMRGQVWDNFSSEDYKNLPAVGAVRFFNPFSSAPRDRWNNNDAYHPPAGGPGYYRPASLISLWATAPYLHNNALGLFNRDPSIEGRLAAFEDGIDKLLDDSRRRADAHAVYGDLRGEDPAIGRHDPGFLYRIVHDSSIPIAAKFIPQLLQGVVGKGGYAVLTLWLWVGLALVIAVLFIWARARAAGTVAVLGAVALSVLLVLTRLDRVFWWLWLIPAALVALALWSWRAQAAPRWVPRAFFGVLFAGVLLAGFAVNRFAAGQLGPIDIGPLPRGVPVNLVMNMNPEAPPLHLVRAIGGLARGMLLAAREHDPAQRRAVFEREAGEAMLAVSKCPDFVLDRGHWFGEHLSATEKAQLKAFLRTL